MWSTIVSDEYNCTIKDECDGNMVIFNKLDNRVRVFTYHLLCIIHEYNL